MADRFPPLMGVQDRLKLVRSHAVKLSKELREQLDAERDAAEWATQVELDAVTGVKNDGLATKAAGQLLQGPRPLVAGKGQPLPKRHAGGLVIHSCGQQ